MYKYESPPGVVTQMQLLGILKQFQVNILTLLLRFLVLELVGILWPWKGQKVSHFFHKQFINSGEWDNLL